MSRNNYGVKNSGYIGGNVTNTVTVGGDNDEVKSLIQQLAHQIEQIESSLSSQKSTTPESKSAEVEQMKNDLEMLNAATSRSKPRREWYELSLNGIKDAATSIGEIGKPVIDTLSKLMPLLLSGK